MRRWLAGAVLVTLGWLASPASVPVYDGIGTDEPYRYVGKSPAPTSATSTVPIRGGFSQGVDIKTGETGPQLIVSLSSGSLQSSASKVTVTLRPIAAEGTPPRGSFDGNVYRISATPATTVSPDASGFVFLRAAVMTKPNPIVVFRTGPGAPWREVSSSAYGRDNLATPFKAIGDYAVVRLPGSKPISAGGIGLTRGLFLGGGVLLLVVITVLVLRRPRDDED
ncbi:MAG: hypothetical protein ABR549_18895 [Mycobacteriales bacterium]